MQASQTKQRTTPDDLPRRLHGLLASPLTLLGFLRSPGAPRAAPRDGLRCPLARFLRAATGSDLEVGTERVYLRAPAGHLPVAPLPLWAQRFVEQVDARTGDSPLPPLRAARLLLDVLAEEIQAASGPTTRNTGEKMDKDNRPRTLGLEVDLHVGASGAPVPYVLGRADAAAERTLAEEHGGFTFKSGEVRAASGHVFHALIELDASSSYENWGVGLAVVEDGRLRIVWQLAPGFDEWLERERRDSGLALFPYRYRYYDRSDAERDHHTGPDGWSVP